MTKKYWYLYIAQCADNTYYTGITTDLDKRLETHNHKQGAKYTRGRLPVKLAYFEKLASESAARKREFEIKKLTRKEKERLINSCKLIHKAKEEYKKGKTTTLKTNRDIDNYIKKITL